MTSSGTRFVLALLGAAIGTGSAPAPAATTETLSATTSARPAGVYIRHSAYFENDGTIAKPNQRTDRHYTAGFGLAWQWRGPGIDEGLSRLPTIAGEFRGPGVSTAMGALVGMEIYTPEDLSARTPQFDDRPYAGWTYVGVMAQRAARQREWPVFEHFELDIGTVGPDGYAGEVQRVVHQLFDQLEPNGWKHQVHDPIGADFKYIRRYRHSLVAGPGDAFAIDFIPEAGCVLGTIHTNVHAATTLRAGWNLPGDFGPGSMQSPADFTASHGEQHPWSLANLLRTCSGYFYLRPTGRFVAHDTTIEGSLWNDDPVEQRVEPWVAQLRAGVSVTMLGWIELGYSQTFTSREFKGQEHCDSYGAWTLSVTRSW